MRFNFILSFFSCLLISFGAEAGSKGQSKGGTDEASPNPVVSQQPVAESEDPFWSRPDPAYLEKWCKDMADIMKDDFGWSLDPCVDRNWKVVGKSVRGRPLFYLEYGDPTSSNTTLVLSMVHADEVTPLYVGLKLIEWLVLNQASLNGNHVIVAPLVNPDAFFRKPRTRTNIRGVDVNRNFATADWEKDALRLWKTRFGSNKRRFPGRHPESEPETLFQKKLIEHFNPQKVLSIHAPLNFMDYDGPNTLDLKNFSEHYAKRLDHLKQELKAKPGGYFPGSLGNYAGQERGIPTFTLELPTANPAKAEEYWKGFSHGIRLLIETKVK